MSNPKPTTADTVYEWLGANPGAHTLDAIAEAADAKRPTVKKALASLVEADQIREVNVDGTDCWTADPADIPEPAEDDDAIAEPTEDDCSTPRPKATRDTRSASAG